MSVIVLPPRVAPPAVPAPVVGGSPWPGRLLPLATLLLLGVAAVVFGARWGSVLIAGMPYADVAVLGLLTLWAPVSLVLPVLTRRGGVR